MPVSLVAVSFINLESCRVCQWTSGKYYCKCGRGRGGHGGYGGSKVGNVWKWLE